MHELSPDRLRRRCDPARLGFATTEEVAPPDGTIGQPRATEAIEFGLEIDSAGYNLVAAGPIGTGKHSILERSLDKRAAGRPSAPDLVCLFNFEAPDRPLMLELPTGSARRFGRDSSQLVDEARRRIRDAFESESFGRRRDRIAKDLDGSVQEALADLVEYARTHDLAVELTPAGLMTVPCSTASPCRRSSSSSCPRPGSAATRRTSRRWSLACPRSCVGCGSWSARAMSAFGRSTARWRSLPPGTSWTS
jgi:AAA domain